MSGEPADVGPQFSFEEADAELVATLDNLDGAHNYCRWIFGLLRPHLGRRILEVGAGHGTFTQMFAPDRQVVATDLSVRCVGLLRERFAGLSNVTVERTDLVGAAEFGPYDNVVLINVLEHIEDDNEALRQIRALLVPGGKVMLWVPAFMRLYSDFDRRIGHYRRYQLPGLEAQLQSAGFAIEDMRYVNSVGAVAWWVVARRLHKTPTGKVGVAVYDRFFVPLLRRIEARYRPPIGQSIIAIATHTG